MEREILTHRQLQKDALEHGREWEADWYRTRCDDLLGEWRELTAERRE